MPIGCNLHQSGTICTKLHNFSTIALLDIKWWVRCSKTWALLLYYYSRFLHASIIANMGEGGAQKLLARPGFEAVSMLGGSITECLLKVNIDVGKHEIMKPHHLQATQTEYSFYPPPKCSVIMFSRRSMAIESNHIGWHENEKKRRRNRWLIQVSFLVPIKHVHRNIMIIIPST